MFLRAEASACFSRPIWWTSAPQQASPFGTTTSTPRRVSSEIAASLIPGSSTGCAQPVRMATRFSRLPVVDVWTPAFAIGDPGGTEVGASLSISATGFSAGTLSKNFAKGWPSFASRSAARNRAGRGSTKASRARIRRSAGGRR